MKINLLGTGGVFPLPRPCCNCRICTEARLKGVENYQTGPSMYLYESSVLFDTPEEIRIQLNRENIPDVKHIILTHWHPDHTQGLRVIEQLTKGKPESMPINVYIASDQLRLFREYGCGNILMYYQKHGIVKIHNFEHNQSIQFGLVRVTPYLIEKTSGFYFLLEGDIGGRVVYAPCEYQSFVVWDDVCKIDVFIPHCLWFENKNIGHGVDFSDTEDSFEDMLMHAKQMGAKRIVITHIEESFGSTLAELNADAKLCYPDYDITFAEDGTVIEI